MQGLEREFRLGLVIIIMCLSSYRGNVSVAQEGKGYYIDGTQQACIEQVVNTHVYLAVNEEKRIAASLLRLHFHDCFVHGCDASILLLDVPNGEKFSPENNHSVRGFELVDRIKETITSQCEVQVSCADILALAAKSGVQAVSPSNLYPTWNVAMGRYDSKSSYANLTSALPGTNDPLEVILKKFANQNLTDIQDVVVLIGGGHTIGFCHCFFVRRLLYGNESTDNTTLYSDSEYVGYLKEKCPESEGSDGVLVALDNRTEDTFDNGFFTSLSKGRVTIRADQLLNAPSNPPYMKIDPVFFLRSFGTAMEKMGQIGILGSDQGEIRTSRYPNDN